MTNTYSRTIKLLERIVKIDGKIAGTVQITTILFKTEKTNKKYSFFYHKVGVGSGKERVKKPTFIIKM